jgi:hypothetical protein
MNIKKSVILLTISLLPIIYSCTAAPILVSETPEPTQPPNEFTPIQDLKPSLAASQATVIITPSPSPIKTAEPNQTITPVVPTATAVPKTSFSGYLVEETTKTPLTKTVLKINQVVALTDDSGYFNFPDIPSGEITIYGYLNGLQREAVNYKITLKPGINKFDLYYINNAGSAPISTATPLVTSTPIPTIATTVTPIPVETPFPASAFSVRDGLIGVWEFSFKSKKTGNIYKSIMAFRNSPNSGVVFYAAEINGEDVADAKSGRVDYHYLSENNLDENNFMYGGYWDNQKQQFFMVYVYYNNPVLQTGEYISSIKPLVAINKNTLAGTESRTVNDTYLGDFSVTAKRLTDSISLIDSDGEVFETYAAKYN